MKPMFAGGIGGTLSDLAVRSFVGRAERGRKLADGGGLHLFITPAGSATWRIKYRIRGKEKLFSVGPYPDVSLAAARMALQEVKAQLRQHKDPVVERRIRRAEAASDYENTFESVAADWLAMKKRQWSAVHYEKSLRAFERDLYPALGKLPIGRLTPAIVAKVVETINRRGVLETATRILQHLNGVFRFAQARGLCRDNPAAPAREVLPRRKNVRNMPALLDLRELGDILRRAEAARLSPQVRLAHRLCAFTAARIGNVIEAEWAEMHLDDEPPVWVIPRAKMKMAARNIDHRVPLGRQIAEELRAWRQIRGTRGFVFASLTGKSHIGRESLEKAYRVTLGLRDRHSPHGWRSAFSTLAREHGFARDVVELSLDHAHDDEVARAYDRGERFDQRVALLTWWGEQLHAAQTGAKVIALNAA